jgi:transcriptional regulator with XRE-family HTH domain
MAASKRNPEAGKRLRAVRERLHFTVREVEELSDKIAERKKSSQYYISHAWLTEAENGKFRPTIYKLYSLSTIYNIPVDEILAFWDINVGDIPKEQRSILLPRTHVLGPHLQRPEQTIRVPVEVREHVQFDKTNLVRRMFTDWADIPIALLHQMDLENSLYGYIGLNDYTLYPLIRPGSFVEIDAQQNKIQSGRWENEFRRPIYFVELRDTYVCSWCEITQGRLVLLPYTRSGQQVRQVRYPGDAEIVGRVTAVAMSLTDDESNTEEPKPV